MKRRALHIGQAMAIHPSAIQRDADGIFVLFSPDIPENQYEDGVACVHIRGPLDHHAGEGDNYDAIRQRAREAFECDEASAVIFRIDSPGGAVSGLYDTVRAIRGMAEASDKRCVAYIDERCFSAAFAIACACDEIVIPESGLGGSIGVISTMAEQTEHDKAQGFRFVTITSGARKADGHIHVPISDEAVAVERKRVEELALQFFQQVKSSRGLPIKTIRGFEAGLFLGQGAVDVGLADRVESFDQLYAELCQSGTALLDTRGTRESSSKDREARMRSYRSQLLEQLKAAKALVASATGTDKIRAEVRAETLAGQLEAYKKVTEKHVEHSKTHEEDEGDQDEEGNETDRGDDEDGDEEKDKKEASGPKKPMKAAAKSKKSEEEDDEEEDEEEAAYEDDEEEAKALVSFVRGATGKRGMAAQGALAAMLSDTKKMGAQLATITRERAQERLSAKVDSALTSRRITKREAKTLLSKPMAYVDAFLEARPSAIFHAVDGDLSNPILPQRDANGAAILPPELEKQLQAAIQASGGTLKRDDVLKDFSARGSSHGANGAAPRE